MTPKEGVVSEMPQYLEGLQKEVKGLNQREQEYFEKARQADMVWFVVGCDDSRQGVPEEEMEIEFDGRMQRVLMHFVPAIGAGVSHEVLPAVIDRYLQEDVQIENMMVVTAQHGNSAEVNAALDGVDSQKKTCGLRGVLQQIEAGEHVHLQEDLLEHAKQTNKSSSIIENGQYVYEETLQLLQGYGIRVVGGYYDHEGDDVNGKSLELFQGLENPVSISIPQQTAWHEGHQDPIAVVFSFGPESVALPDGIIFPDTVGTGANNDFNIACVNIESLSGDFSETWYPAHYINTENSNFKTTQLMSCICDNQQYVDALKVFLQSDTFRSDYAPHIRRLPDQGIYITNKETETVEFVRV